jgi:ABC-type thiamin/hydroxymethylpyrimidine transport system permease subunit
VLLAGLGGHALVRALARAGALDAFGPGAEYAARSDTP